MTSGKGSIELDFTYGHQIKRWRVQEHVILLRFGFTRTIRTTNTLKFVAVTWEKCLKKKIGQALQITEESEVDGFVNSSLLWDQRLPQGSQGHMGKPVLLWTKRNCTFCPFKKTKGKTLGGAGGCQFSERLWNNSSPVRETTGLLFSAFLYGIECINSDDGWHHFPLLSLQRERGLQKKKPRDADDGLEFVAYH